MRRLVSRVLRRMPGAWSSDGLPRRLAEQTSGADADGVLARAREDLEAPDVDLPAVRRGAVAQVVGAELVAAVSPPTALSVTWGLDELLASLTTAEAAQVA